MKESYERKLIEYNPERIREEVELLRRLEHDKKDLRHGGTSLLARSNSGPGDTDHGVDDDQPKMDNSYVNIDAKYRMNIELPPHATPGEISGLSKQEMITILKAKNYTPGDLNLPELRALYICL